MRISPFLFLPRGLSEDLPHPSDAAAPLRQQCKLACGQHLRCLFDVVEKRAALQLVEEQSFQLEGPAVASHAIEKCLIELPALSHRKLRATLNGHHAQCVHDCGDIDLHRAASGAGFTGSTQPDRVRCQDLALGTKMDEAHDLTGDNVHLLTDGASGRALVALQARAHHCAAAAFDLT